MPTKADFNADEWATILAGPPAAGMRVAMAERGGTLRESLTIGRAYAEARQEHGESELLDAIVAEQPSINPAESQGESDVPAALTEKLRQAVETLAAKGTDTDVDAYKRFIVDLAQRVASAKKEGGVLGIGGKEISDNEQLALDEIAATLNVGPSA
jgi:hypothetical protein